MSSKQCPKCGSKDVKLKKYAAYAGDIAGSLSGIPFMDKIGKIVGKKVDKHLISKYKCRKCGEKFEL